MLHSYIQLDAFTVTSALFKTAMQNDLVVLDLSHSAHTTQLEALT